MSFKKRSAVFFFFICASFLVAQNTPKKSSFINANNSVSDVDLEHTKLKVSLDFEQEQLYGEAWLLLKPHYHTLNKIALDAKGMLIHKVLVEDKTSSYRYDGEHLFIELNKEYTKQDSINVYVKYTARPDKVKQVASKAITSSKGLYFVKFKQNSDKDFVQVWTQGAPTSSSCWFPTIDKPNQKTSQELFITVPDKFKTLSNGKLVSEKTEENGLRTDYWKMDQKHAPYLFFMGVGDFAIVKDTWRGKELSYYVEKEYEPLAKAIFGKTPKMLDYFSEITGVDFVWDKYSQIVVRDYVSGAMENTTAVVHGEGAYQSEGDLIDQNIWEPTIAHELFHHWFGNLVTTENWSNLSLNESFANYSEYLWLLHEYGKDRADAHLYKSNQVYFSDVQNKSKSLVRFDYLEKGNLFDAVSYNKGGAVLHMLKNYIGEAAFFEGLQKYLTRYQYKTAEVHQLRIVFEEVTGLDLNWFFDQWFYGEGHPEVSVTYNYDVLANTVTVNLEQLGRVFYFPLLIEIHEGESVSSQELFVDSKQMSFIFTYGEKPDWIHVNANHVVLGEFIENTSLRDGTYEYRHAKHYIDRKNAIEKLANSQDDKKYFSVLVEAIDDPYYELQVLALDRLNLGNKYAKKDVVAKVELMSKTAKNNFVKAAAIKVLGKLVNYEYKSIFLRGIESESNLVRGNSLEALYYIDNYMALEKAKNLPDNVKETIAFPLSKMYLEARDREEMSFVSKHIVQGMYLVKDPATVKMYKEAFEWVAVSDNVEAFRGLVGDLVEKGNMYRQYGFHLKAIQMIREMIYKQEELENKNKRQLLAIAREGLEELVN